MRGRTDLRSFHESTGLAAFRFALELIAWILIYAAWGLFPFVIAIVATSVLGVPGDKHLVIVAVPGRIRLLIEALLALAGVTAAATTLGAGPALLFGSACLGLAVLARHRWIWLWNAAGH
jgi:hypothetical protein